jgi:hypothetical protein
MTLCVLEEMVHCSAPRKRNGSAQTLLIYVEYVSGIAVCFPELIAFYRIGFKTNNLSVSPS